jgi:hypothetical protein
MTGRSIFQKPQEVVLGLLPSVTEVWIDSFKELLAKSTGCQTFSCQLMHGGESSLEGALTEEVTSECSPDGNGIYIFLNSLICTLIVLNNSHSSLNNCINAAGSFYARELAYDKC